MNKAMNTIGYISAAMLLLAAHSAAAMCWNDIPATTPDRDFTLHNDGTVTHNKTGLMWMRCSLGQTRDGSTCTGKFNSISWDSAVIAAQNHSFAGHSDWRLPNRYELARLEEDRCTKPAVNTRIFPGVTGMIPFWSSSVDREGFVWYVSLYNGRADRGSKAYNNQVLLVR